MRNPLSKRVPRELKKNLLRYLGMILILVCTICAGTSFQSALNGAMKYLSDIKETNIQEDGFFKNDGVKEYLAEDYTLVKSTSKSGYYEVKGAERAAIGSTKYASLTKALAAAKTGDYIQTDSGIGSLKIRNIRESKRKRSNRKW